MTFCREDVMVMCEQHSSQGLMSWKSLRRVVCIYCQFFQGVQLFSWIGSIKHLAKTIFTDQGFHYPLDTTGKNVLRTVCEYSENYVP